MGVRRIRTVRDQRRGGEPSETGGNLQRYDGFSLQLAGRRGVLTYRDDVGQTGDLPYRVVFAELDIPGLEFPVDLSRGVSRFRHRLLKISALTMSIDGLEFTRWLYEVVPFLVHVELRFEQEMLSVAADIDVDGTVVPITFRLKAASATASVDGAALVPSALWAYTDQTAVGRLAIDKVRGFFADLSNAGSNTASALLRPALVELFPVRGWRLPLFDEIQIVRIGGSQETGTVEFARWGSGATERVSLVPGPGDALAALLERFHETADVDEELEALSLLFRNGNVLEKTAAAKRLSTILETGIRQTPQLLEGLVDYLPEDPIIFEKYVRASARSVERTVLLQYINRWLSYVSGAGERVYSLVRAGEILLSEANLPEDAYAYFEKAALADPGDFDANFGMALAQSALGKFHRAEGILDRLETLASQDGNPAKMARIIAAHGELSIAQRRHEAAREHFKRALDLDPTLEWAQKRMLELTESDS